MNTVQTQSTVDIIIIDDLPPENVAMLQALYSRDPRSVREHLETVKRVGSGKFMGTYYVGYGHKSIGDCGTTSIFIENVSMLTAKAIQQWALYSGQEVSTRYIDMINQPMLNPLGTPEGEAIQLDWMKLYHETVAALIPWLKEQYPRQEDQDPAVWEKAIKARSFDIGRSLIPAGCMTCLSWHTNLRQAADKLKLLRHHPLTEIRGVAEKMTDAVKAKYPSSFRHKVYPADEEYVEMCAHMLTYSDEKASEFKAWSNFDLDGLSAFATVLKKRPPMSELPQELRAFGNARFKFLLDFGSYRDLQRQRSMVHIMPLLTMRHGFHPWYLNALSPEIRGHVETEVQQISERVAALHCNEMERQYYIAMGYRVMCDISCPLPAAVYIAELRSGQTVHPTLRPIAQEVGDWLENNVPNLTMHYDRNPDVWSIKRGSQDIVRKEPLEKVS